MIGRDDLSAAVRAGIISESQAISIMTLAVSRREEAKCLKPIEEPFKIFNGLNEIFIVVGLGILTLGWYSTSLLFIGSRGFEQIPILSFASAVFIWLLCEYFIRHRRMLAPAIILSLLWTGNASLGFSFSYAEIFMIIQQDYSSLLMPIGLTMLSLLVFWWRFALPFVMVLIALGTFSFALLLTAVQTDTPATAMNIFLLSREGPFAWVTLAVGICVFAVAMWFDMSDPYRITRRSDQGFWLHIVAAPVLTNTFALSLIEQETVVSNLLLLLVLAVISLVSVIIDRRSFLISSAGYCVALSIMVFDEFFAGGIFLGLGVFLLTFGSFWERIRCQVILLLKPVLPIKHLPPTI
ncbi:MAG: hypothetical protein OXC62_09610 [Aestuariivita sp.]|nr:hypothetical protein [Aestuariivita sp.]